MHSTIDCLFVCPYIDGERADPAQQRGGAANDPCWRFSTLGLSGRTKRQNPARTRLTESGEPSGARWGAPSRSLAFVRVRSRSFAFARVRSRSLASPPPNSAPPEFRPPEFRPTGLWDLQAYLPAILEAKISEDRTEDSLGPNLGFPGTGPGIPCAGDQTGDRITDRTGDRTG